MKKFLIIFSILLIAGFATINAQDVNVTFQVDMSVQIQKGFFNPDSEVVTVPGGFNNWLSEPPANTEKTMDDTDGDSIYTKTIAMAPNATYEYKYNIGLGWDGKDELGGQPNRSFAVTTSDTTLDVVFFNNETIGGAASVTFNVDMQLPAQSAFNPLTDKVYIAGNFTDWQNAAAELSDTDGDTVYTVTIDTLTGGETLMFKFLYGDTAAAATWEDDPNRELFIIDGDNSFLDWWNRQSPNVQTGNGNIKFTVDMSVMEEANNFDKNVDSVRIYGSFNGWGPNDPIYTMNQNFLALDEWFQTVPFTDEPINADELYKFFVQLADTNSMWTDGWERPLSLGGGNRSVPFAADDNQEVAKQYYDDVLPNYVIESGNSIDITFSVDMTAATQLTFNPATDEVWWIGEQPSFVNSQGWEDSDTMRVLQLTDTNSDMVYEGTLTVNGPSWNGFVYRYAYINQGAWNQEPSGFGDFAYRVRYVEQNGYRSFVQPYSAPQDSWLDQEDKSSQSETGPSGTVSVRERDLIANQFKLDQNYPNPFNPATKISFSIPQAGLVTLKVYNLLGQEVTTLINQEMTSGSFEVDFNASTLSSGVYFYTIKSGDFTATRKMMLLK